MIYIYIDKNNSSVGIVPALFVVRICMYCVRYTANVAVDKTASMSSTFRRKVPANAVDNDGATAACTKYTTPEPWWSVDLGEGMDVSCVCVTNDHHRRYG